MRVMDTTASSSPASKARGSISEAESMDFIKRPHRHTQKPPSTKGNIPLEIKDEATVAVGERGRFCHAVPAPVGSVGRREVPRQCLAKESTPQGQSQVHASGRAGKMEQQQPRGATDPADLFTPRNLWKPPKARRHPPAQVEAGAGPPQTPCTPRTPRTPRKFFEYREWENTEEDAARKAQQVMSGVFEDAEKLRLEREKWEVEKEDAKRREVEEQQMAHRAILTAQESFFARGSNSSTARKLQMVDIPFLEESDVHKILKAVEDPKKTCKWLELRWHPGETSVPSIWLEP